jgi:peptidoglycan/xylan/chitin deacetylase (PgdA/CDA1 family)
MTVLGVAAVLVSFGIVRQLSAVPVTIVAGQASAPAPAADRADSARPTTAVSDTDASPPHQPEANSTPDSPVAAPSASPTPAADEARDTTATVAPGAKPSARPAASDASSLAPSPVRERTAFGPPGPPRATAEVPIVMYHHVGLLPANADVLRRDLTVSPAVFAQTLDYLAEQKIETVTMAEVFDHFVGGPSLPKKSIVLTFDDGYDDNYDHAFRLLQERGMVGTFFITTDFVERPGYLTWAQIIEMAEAGMEIAAHSANHADFTKIGPSELRRQLMEPKQMLEEAVGRPVRFLAYPAGKYNPAVMAASRAAGYQAAVTVLHGTRHTPTQAFELRRVRAHGADSVRQIAARFTPAAWR